MEPSKLQKTVVGFLRLHKIQGGSCKTPLFVLYYKYVRYCWGNQSKKVSPIEFGRRMSISFVKGKSGRFSYYLTNLEAPEAKERRKMRIWYNRIWARMRNEQKK